MSSATPSAPPASPAAGWDPHPLERRVLEDAAVADAVQRDPAGHAEVGEAGAFVEVAGAAHHHLLGHLLDGGGDVHVALRQLGVGPTRRAAEQGVEPRWGHRQAVCVRDVAQVESKRPVGLEVHQVLADRLRVHRLAVGGESHELVLAGVDLEAAVVGERGVEQAERVREPQLGVEADPVAAPDALRRGRPLPDAVEGEDRRLLERRGEERARGVGLVVLGEQEALAVTAGEAAPQLAGQVQLLLEPQRRGHQVGPQPPGRVREVGLQQPVELANGLS